MESDEIFNLDFSTMEVWEFFPDKHPHRHIEPTPPDLQKKWEDDAFRDPSKCRQCNETLIVKQTSDFTYCPQGHCGSLKGEGLLRFFDETGAGWIRETIDDTLDAEVID